MGGGCGWGGGGSEVRLYFMLITKVQVLVTVEFNCFVFDYVHLFALTLRS
jgi:hypothetical protein